VVAALADVPSGKYSMVKFSSVFESPLRVKSAGWGAGHSPEQFWHRAEPP